MRHVGRLAVLAAAIAAGTAAAAPSAEPRPCTPPEVRRAVTTFITAFNRGDRRLLASVWAAEPDFRWYSTPPPGERLRAAAQHRPSLVPYFLRRRARGERLQLTWLRVNGNTDAARPYGNFEYRLIRRAHDLAPTEYQGKGALHCYSGRTDELIVWSMADAVSRP